MSSDSQSTEQIGCERYPHVSASVIVCLWAGLVQRDDVWFGSAFL